MSARYQDVVGPLQEAYDGGAELRDGMVKEPWKLAERAAFLERVREAGQRLLEIGAGTGHDSVFFQDGGLTVVAVDLSPAMVELCRRKGVEAHVSDFLNLGFRAGVVRRGVRAELPAARAQPGPAGGADGDPRGPAARGPVLRRRVRGHRERREGPLEGDQHDPPRFFSWRSDDDSPAVRAGVLRDRGLPRRDVGRRGFHFQSLTLRRPADLGSRAVGRTATRGCAVRAVVVDAFGAPPALRDVPTRSARRTARSSGSERAACAAATGTGGSGHDETMTVPYVPGHEWAGEVVEVGADVHRWAVGTRVTAPFVQACGVCPQCIEGEQQVCADQRQPGFTDDGAFAELVVAHRADLNLVDAARRHRHDHRGQPRLPVRHCVPRGRRARRRPAGLVGRGPRLRRSRALGGDDRQGARRAGGRRRRRRRRARGGPGARGRRRRRRPGGR